MRAILFGMLFIGLTSLSFAQELNDEAQEVVLEGVTVTALNMNYLNEVHDAATPEIVKGLETRAAGFDIKKSPNYNDDFGPYKVYFSNSKGRIIATYNRNGEILASSEKFKDVILPIEVRNAVYSRYPDWTVESNVYLVSYYHRKGVNKMYQFNIGKDGMNKNLKIGVDGNLIQ